MEFELRPSVKVDGGFGVSRVVLPGPDASKTGPAGHISMRKVTEHAQFTIGAMRSFVPNYGFGGSIRNQQVIGTVRVPFARNRAYSSGSVAWRKSQPVLVNELGLESVWVLTTVGYSFQRWVALEGFYNGAFQSSTVAGGRVDRNRIGVQIVDVASGEAEIDGHLSPARLPVCWCAAASGGSSSLPRCASSRRRSSRFLPRVYRSAATISVASPAVSADLLKQAGPLSPRRAHPRHLPAAPQPRRPRAGRARGTPRARWQRRRGRRPAARAERDQGGTDGFLKQVTSKEGPQLDAFLLSYAAGSPTDARRVADTLARVFVEASSRTREARAEDTSAFISTQLDASKTRLDELEERLRKAKESYMGRLPEQTQSNLSIVAGMRQQLESTSNSLRGEQDRLSMIERQIDSMKQGAGDFAMPGRSTMSSAQARVLQLQQELANARGMYTEKHPEIQRLQDDLAAARREAAADREKPDNERLDQLQLDPGYRQLLADRETARLRVRDLQRAESQMRTQVAAYQSRIEAAPMVEQQLASLQREYDLEKHQYTELSAKLQAAELAESLERRRGGEQFQIFVRRVRAARAGIAQRGASASRWHRARDRARRRVRRRPRVPHRSVHDVRALQAEFDVPVLGEISRISRAA